MKKMVFIILFFIISFHLSASLLTHLKFDGNLDDSYGNSNAKRAGNGNDYYFYSLGQIDKSLKFDGVNYFEIGLDSFDPRGNNGTYTISLWVYSTERASSSNANSYIGKHTSSGGNEFLFGYWNGSLSLTINNDIEYFSSLGSEPLYTWVHYVIAAQEVNGITNVNLYKNGEQVWAGIINDTMDSNSSGKSWVLGQDWDSSTATSDFFKGQMDSVRFYNTKLSEEEVKEIYNKESSILHLNFDNNFLDDRDEADGTQTGGVVFKEGMENRAAYFDGVNDYVEFGTGTTDPRNSAGRYSISLWVKSDQQATSSNNNSYIGKHTANGVDNSFLFGYWNNQLSLRLLNHVQFFSSGTEPLVWTHYVIVGSEGTSFTNVVVYKNGEVLWSGTINDKMGTFLSNDKPWVLAQDWDSGNSKSDFFKGEIDNVRFYDRTLSEDDVKSLYRSEFSGIRFCDSSLDSNRSCSVTKGTEFDLDNYGWTVPSGNPNIPYLFSKRINVSSIKVSEGWEAYLCNNTNNNGSCYYYNDGVYASLPANINNNTYSITTQPASFDYAVKYYGIHGFNDAVVEPFGFAYLYDLPEYQFSSQTNAVASYKRLLLVGTQSLAIDDFSNLIIKNDTISSVELFGNITLDLGEDTNDYKILNSSHRNLGWFGYTNGTNSLDFRSYNNSVNLVYPVRARSIGWFMASDFPSTSVNKLEEVCLNGIRDVNQMGNNFRIECLKYDKDSFAYDISATHNDQEFYERVYYGNEQKFNKYTDNYEMLILSGHGRYTDLSVWDQNDDLRIALPYQEYSDNYFYYDFNHSPDDRDVVRIAEDDLSTKAFNESLYTERLGQFKTRWLLTTACYSFGYDGLPWSRVADMYYPLLTRLNGIGGYRNISWWGRSEANYQYENFWNYLTNDNMPISKAWVYAWSADFTGIYERDARFLTLETCDCTQSSCTSTYMKTDYMYNTSVGVKPRKTNVQNYNYYCFRDKENDNLTTYTKSRTSQSASSFKKYSFEAVSNSDLEELFTNSTKTLNENFKIRKDGKNISVTANRKFEPFSEQEDWEYGLEKKLAMAKEIAQSLTTLYLEYTGTSRDTIHSFSIEEPDLPVKTLVNSVAFVFKPKIDGIPIFAEKIEVEFDEEGLFQVRSRVPYSIKLEKESKIKSDAEVSEEIYSKLGIEEKGILFYVLDENNNLTLSKVVPDEQNKEFLTISMEADDEK